MAKKIVKRMDWNSRSPLDQTSAKAPSCSRVTDL